MKKVPTIFQGFEKTILPVKQMVILFVVAILFGSLTGFAIYKLTAASASDNEKVISGKSENSVKDGKKEVKNSKSAGIVDKEEFPDKAEGKLMSGGLEGVGTHHLERKGGESQNVYLTSSAVDLSLFEGKKVKVMGKTYESDKAGWFMDVGYIEVK
jgi:hypothetical protein